MRNNNKSNSDGATKDEMRRGGNDEDGDDNI